MGAHVFDRPFFSIVVPSFNHVQFIGQTLDSILGQDYRPLEIIVADGGSRDGTVELLERYAASYPELRWLSEPDEGPADAVNKGLAMAEGDIIGIQSSDDIYYPGAFEEVIKVFSSDPEIGFVYGDVEGIDEEDRILYRNSLPDFSWEAFFAVSCSLPQSSIFFRKEISDEAGGWNGDYYGCDIDYWMRLLFRTKAAHVRRPLSGWRIYTGQRTSQDAAEKIWNGYWRMIEASSDVANSSRRIRRLARASCHIMALRFPPRQSRAFVWRHIIIATLLHPGIWRYNGIRRFLRWTPGADILRSSYRNLRAKLGKAPQVRYAMPPTTHGKEN